MYYRRKKDEILDEDIVLDLGPNTIYMYRHFIEESKLY